MKMAHYDSRKGWENTDRGWHEYAIHQRGRDIYKMVELQDRIMEWMYRDLPLCERHCRWKFDTSDVTDYVLRFKFRREQDYLLFIMKWA